MTYDLALDVDPAFEADLDAPALRAMLEAVLAADRIEDGAGLTLLVAGDEVLQRLNLAHRDVDAPTDVLSFATIDDGDEAFPQPEGAARYLGDIAVSVDTVRRQAPEAGLTFEDELRHVVLHGLLHLLGYDHETADDEAVMRAREESVLGPEIHAQDAGHSDQ